MEKHVRRSDQNIIVFSILLGKKTDIKGQFLGHFLKYIFFNFNDASS